MFRRVLGDPVLACRSCVTVVAVCSELEMLERPSGRPLPAAARVHHVLEDFLTEWTARTSHLLPLRRFLEACLERDLRHFSRRTCLRHALTNRRRPLGCG